MVTVKEALDLILSSVHTFDPVETLLQDANGRTLSEDIFSPHDIPGYPQSSMDGYAFAFEEGRNQYQIVGEVAAGSDQFFILEAGKAVRIFTGAAVPQGADTVLMQEKASVENEILIFSDGAIKRGDNLRAVGSEILKGSKALAKGDILNPARIGFLAGIGIDRVRCYRRPKVSILVTGNELQEIGQPLTYGQVYDSNSWTLRACLEIIGISQITRIKSADDISQLSTSLNEAMENSDLILMTGGVSVGDYDYTLRIFEACGVTQHLHKIKQKPGKPLLFGTKNKKAVFGLPGNPASVLTCFYEYVLPTIGKMMNQDISLKRQTVPIADEHVKVAGLTHFLKGVYDGQVVKLQKGQESYKLSSFSTANCLVVLPEDATRINKGDLVEIHLIP